MAAVIGVLIDVSASMKNSAAAVRGGQNVGSWAQSTFRIVDEFIKNDVSPDNKVFVIGYGAKEDPGIFDLLHTVRNATFDYGSYQCKGSKSERLRKILRILETKGAPYVREWASMDILHEEVSDEDVNVILSALSNNCTFMRRFVEECLPEECKERSTSWSALVVEKMRYVPWFGNTVAKYVSQSKTKEYIRKAIGNCRDILRESIFVRVSRNAVMGVHEARELLQAGLGDENLTDDRVDKLMRAVEPFIYGSTPMIKALHEARNLMADENYVSQKKVLFVLSAGMPSDGTEPPHFSDVDVVACYITDSHLTDSKRLYNTEQSGWDKSALFMFRLSSSIQTQLLPRTIFVKRGWTVDTYNNETRLFLQINHPDLIYEVCSFVRDVVCSQEALNDFLTSIDLDLYINKANQGFGANIQEGGTSYINAVAAVMYLAMKRIVGREGGYPDFFTLRAELIDRYGGSGANTVKVLEEMCPRYRLHCRKVNVAGALEAVTAKRPVIARFRLTDEEWDQFSQFYRDTPKGILTVNHIDISRRRLGEELYGHAVVLTSFNSKGLTLMNSWGSEWGNNGFFSVSNASVLGLKFVDVYWTTHDLKPSEITAYENEGPRIANKLMTSLTSLKNAKYTCPLCLTDSRVQDYTGHLKEVRCAKCLCVFDTNREGTNDLVLNLYLTSLCR